MKTILAGVHIKLNKDNYNYKSIITKEFHEAIPRDLHKFTQSKCFAVIMEELRLALNEAF